MLLCPECEPNYHPILSKQDSEIWYATEYTDEFAKVINSYKENGRVALVNHLALALDQLLSRALDHSTFSEIVFTQSSRANFRKRGFNPMKFLLSKSKIATDFKLKELKLIREVNDQSNLNRHERVGNVAGAFRAASDLDRVLLLDDIRSTGATLEAMATAVEETGGQVVGRAVLAINF
ncbi:MAG: hypothetical protein RLZZ579_441 [Actinomycetota bacterium]|jgi:predicted amidophosphoribosyltransferase